MGCGRRVAVLPSFAGQDGAVAAGHIVVSSFPGSGSLGVSLSTGSPSTIA